MRRELYVIWSQVTDHLENAPHTQRHSVVEYPHRLRPDDRRIPFSRLAHVAASNRHMRHVAASRR